MRAKPLISFISIVSLLLIQACNSSGGGGGGGTPAPDNGQSSEAAITSLVVTVSGVDHTIDFDDARQATINYPYGSPSAGVIVKDIAVAADATSDYDMGAIIVLTDGKASITVTTKDGEKHIYTIHLVEAKNSEAAITNLVLALNGTPKSIDFDGTTDATVTYQYSQDTTPDTIQLTSIAMSYGAIAAIGDTTIDSNANLDMTIDISGSNPSVDIVVTSEDGSTSSTYTITITLSRVEAETLKEIKDLDISLSLGATSFEHLNIAFNENSAATVSVEFPYGTSASDFPDNFSISNIATSDGASVSQATGSFVIIDSLQEPRTASITVTADDGTTQAYTLTFIFTIANNTEANIDALVVSVLEVDHTIDFGDNREATVDYPYSATALSNVLIKSISLSADATAITADNPAIADNSTVRVINDQVTIAVTAQDGSTIQTYTIHLVMSANTAADITNLVISVSGTDHTIDFGDNRQASVGYPYGSTAPASVTVKGIVVSEQATATVSNNQTVDLTDDKLTITVTAQDGTSTQSYTIRLVMSANTEADITNLVISVSGADRTIGFDANREATVYYPYTEVLSSVTVRALSLSAEATSDYGAGATIDVSNDQATITVTAQDGETEHTYTINLVMLANTAADITSLVLTVSGADHTIAFDDNRQATVEYPYSATALSSITVKSIVVSDQATVSTAKDATIDVLSNTATITVTAQDGTDQTYTINLVMLANTAADITSLAVNVSGVDHTIDFGDNRQATINYPYGSAAPATIVIESISLSANATSNHATGAAISVVNNQATIIVIAQDGTIAQTYTINLVMADNTEADITSLIVTVSGADHTLDFDENEQATINYPYGAAPASITIKSISLSANATSDHGAGTNISVANDQITITVTAQDGTTAQTYTINLVMLANTAADITSLIVTASEVDYPITFGDNKQATINYPYQATALTSVIVKSIVISAEATANVSDDQTVDLADGKITITVTAQDSETKQTYTINLLMLANTAADITSLIVTASEVDYLITFDDNKQATINYPYQATALTSVIVKSIIISAEATANVSDDQTVDLADGKITITVTAQDSETKQTYTINLLMLANTEADITSLVVNVSGADHTVSFDANREATIDYPYSATALSSITIKSIGISAYATANVSDDQTVDLADGKITITVTAQDSETKQTYTINLLMLANTAADITSLIVTASEVDYPITFDDNKQATINYPYSATALSSVIVKSIGISAEATSDHGAGATIDVSNDQVTITVTAQDGTDQTYTLNLVMLANTAADITRLIITVSESDYTIAFDNARQATINYPYGSAAPATITIKSISLVADATSDYDSGETIILTDDSKAVITVTAQNGTEQTYTIRLVAEENSAAVISSLTLKLIDSTSDSSKSISFDGTTTEATIEYQYTQATAPDTIQLTSIAMSYGAIASIGDATTDGSNNLPVDIAITGANPSVAIVVTAEDGKDSKTYTVTISLTKVNPDSLKEITDLDITLMDAGSNVFVPKLNIAFNEANTATVSHEFAYGYSGQLPDRIFINNIAVSAGASANVSNYNIVTIDNLQDSRIVTITVTAKDGSTQAYTLRFIITIATQNSAAIITSLTLKLIDSTSDSSKSISFDATTTEATIEYQYTQATVPDTIQLTSIAMSAGAIVAIGDKTTDGSNNLPVDIAITGANPSVAIVVTAEDGKDSKTYTVTISLTKVNPDSLKEITDLDITLMDAGSNVFVPKHNIAFNEANTATVSHEFAYGFNESYLPDRIFINNIAVSAGASANVSNNNIVIIDNLQDSRIVTITVTAKDGSTQAYTLRFIITIATQNSAAIITSLTLKLIDSTSDSSKSISFDATTTEATIEYQYTQDTTPDTIQLTSIAMSAGAIVAIGDKTTDGSNNLPVDIAITGANPSVAIVVTAEDGSASKTYTVTISLNKVDPNSLKEITDLDIWLADSLGAFSGTAKNNIAFDADHTATVYHEYAYGTSESALPDRISISNIAVSAGASANVFIRDTIIIDNSQDARIVTITVTAADGSEQAYTLSFNITIAKNTEANIKTLVVSVSGTDHPVVFDDARRATINYPYGSAAPASITINSISLSADATSDHYSGETIILTDGKVIITVTAQDGSNKAYTIQLVQTAASSEATITSLIVSVSGVERTISFDANRQAGTYYFYGDSTPDSVKITSIAISAYATANVSDDQTVDLADDKITIRVTAQDGTVQTYSITLAQTKPSLIKNILEPSSGTSTVPTDLSGYDELTKAVLAPYSANATLVARYITIAGGAAPQGGLSWDDAAPASQLKPILDGISDATSDKVYLILVASGATADQSYDARLEMVMKNHVAIIGGWDTIGGWGRSGTTVLSGGGSHRVFNNNYSESSPLGSTSLLYGLTIAAGSRYGNGGGMRNTYASPTLTNLTFSGNSAISGGGIYNDNSSPTLTNIVFSANSASNNGGGIYNTYSSPSMTNITLSANEAGSGGGGIYNVYSSPSMTNITLSANSAGESGGGISNNHSSSPSMTNITLSANEAGSGGGGIYNVYSSPSMTNITLSANSAKYGGGIYNFYSSPSMSNITLSANSAGEGGGMYISNSIATTMINSIFWDNTADTGGAQIHIDEKYINRRLTLAYSVIEGGAPANVTISTNLVTTDDPSLADLTTDTGSAVATHAISTGSSAINAGIYVRRNGDNFYYSEDNTNWYTGFDNSGLTDSTSDTAATAEGSIDITATDATGRARSDRPDAGAYEARQ